MDSKDKEILQRAVEAAKKVDTTRLREYEVIRTLARLLDKPGNHIPDEDLAVVLGRLSHKIRISSDEGLEALLESGLLAEYARIIREIYDFSMSFFGCKEFFLEAAADFKIEF